MKIVFVNEGIYAYASGDPDAVGGAERQQWHLARALAATGWSVTVGAREALKTGERQVIEGVDFVGISGSQVLLAWHRLLSSERPQWLIWKGASHLWGPLVEIAKRAGARTIFHTAFDNDVYPRRGLFRRRHWWPLYAWGLARTDKIFLQHQGQLSELAPSWRSKAYMLPAIAGRIGAVKPHFERAKYVAWVAMLRQPKRPDVLIKIARKAPAIQFVVCGGPSTHRSPPGYSQRIAEALCALPNIEYRGQVTPDQAMQVIADAAVLLSTSEEEGFPNTFLQAWSSGTPVVSLRIDPDRIIQELRLGTVSGSIEDTIAETNSLLASPQQREEIAGRARQYVVERHSEAPVILAFERAIQDIRP
jgi:glycosyltransferase involved in cell wall biosynthesis